MLMINGNNYRNKLRSCRCFYGNGVRHRKKEIYIDGRRNVKFIQHYKDLG